MPEYIEREALKNRLRAYNCVSTNDNADYNRGLNAALYYVAPMIITEQPAADVAPVVHGRWINEGVYVTTAYGSLDVYRCSVCDREITIDDFDSYCPNCGARMDGEGK